MLSEENILGHVIKYGRDRYDVQRYLNKDI